MLDFHCELPVLHLLPSSLHDSSHSLQGAQQNSWRCCAVGTSVVAVVVARWDCSASSSSSFSSLVAVLLQLAHPLLRMAHPLLPVQNTQNTTNHPQATGTGKAHGMPDATSPRTTHSKQVHDAVSNLASAASCHRSSLAPFRSPSSPSASIIPSCASR